ncbi:hypothetical protein NK718_13370 [Alsobacter sp. SYSU M60028]|uniref:Uncharacterized protein n=1 Tax=Alsobacter ponti TaxID=2962936 RepID=A0ABT1LDD1_9HYPH|nr:hypothetical protein [Alsobacter ponti]MCP8939510.1 hypothetical protein [Alsobacter ponti]
MSLPETPVVASTPWPEPPAPPTVAGLADGATSVALVEAWLAARERWPAPDVSAVLEEIAARLAAILREERVRNDPACLRIVAEMASARDLHVLAEAADRLAARVGALPAGARREEKDRRAPATDLDLAGRFRIRL